MPVIKNFELEAFTLPGITHQTIADHKLGVNSMEVWKQTIQSKSATPVHRHACEEVIVVLQGSGQVTVEGKTVDFGPNSTLIVPPDVIHQIVNTGEEDMHLIAALGMSPVKVRTAEDTPLPLPWDAS